jgi:hypothetical protein
MLQVSLHIFTYWIRRYIKKLWFVRDLRHSARGCSSGPPSPLKRQRGGGHLWSINHANLCWDVPGVMNGAAKQQSIVLRRRARKWRHNYCRDIRTAGRVRQDTKPETAGCIDMKIRVLDHYEGWAPASPLRRRWFDPRSGQCGISGVRRDNWAGHYCLSYQLITPSTLWEPGSIPYEIIKN